MTFRHDSGRAALVVAACALAALGALPGSPARTARADQKSDMAAVGAAFGSIDMQKAAEDSKLRQKYEDEWRQYTGSLDGALQRLANGSARLLSEAEIRELAALYQKPTPLGDADQKRAAALEGKADAAGAELAKLQQNASPSDADKKRYTDLTDTQRKGDAVLHAIQEEFQNMAQNRHDQLLQKMTGDIREAVNKVAKEKGLSVVFDAQVAVYTQNDITAEVVKRLSK